MTTQSHTFARAGYRGESRERLPGFLCMRARGFSAALVDLCPTGTAGASFLEDSM
ncbi:MAG: hypothetical protein KGL39_34505 [Patescibacteria group bacterium]|nr:hypothetical protein [Patescibacteria group bacterium]